MRDRTMKTRTSMVMALLMCLWPVSGVAYDTQLDAAAIHEAYVLGQRNDKSTGDFLAPYLAQITEPQNDVHIAEIELLTPYAQVVDLSRRKTAEGYSEAQAVADYKRHGNIVTVNVVMMLPSAYPKTAETNAVPTPPPATGTQKSALKPENFWQNFKFTLKQGGKIIPSRGISNEPIYSTATNSAPATLDGENVWLQYDAKDVGSVETIVEVVTPEGKTIKANFDLKKLR
jgi:hypothetical protein